MLKIGKCTLTTTDPAASPVVPAIGKTAVVFTTIISNAEEAAASVTITVDGHAIVVPVPAGDTVWQTYKYVVSAAAPLTVAVTEGTATISIHYDDGGAA